MNKDEWLKKGDKHYIESNCRDGNKADRVANRNLILSIMALVISIIALILSFI